MTKRTTSDDNAVGVELFELLCAELHCGFFPVLVFE